MNKTIPAAFSIVLFLIAAVSVNAQPSPPNQFFGSVAINGVAAPDGVLVEARISGQFVAGTTTAGGGYGYSPNIFYVTNNDGSREGKTVEFYVQNVKAGQAVFHTGESTQLDLSASIANFCGDTRCDSGESCSSCSSDCGACAPSGGGGGGSVSGGTGTGTTGGQSQQSSQPAGCTESWICTDWNECSNSLQKRVCADVNRCGTNTSKPIETQSCVTPKICQENATKCENNIMYKCLPSGTGWMETQICDKGCFLNVCAGSAPFTGFFLMESGSLTLGIAAVIVIALVALYYLRIRKGNKKPVFK